MKLAERLPSDDHTAAAPHQFRNFAARQSISVGRLWPRSALAKMVRGVSTRNYEGVVESVREGFGIQRSSVSRHFVKATAKQVEELSTRRLTRDRDRTVFNRIVQPN